MTGLAMSDEDWADGFRAVVPAPALRVKAHDLFDPIWKSGKVKRGTAYRHLAFAMGMTREEAHFRLMDRKTLERAIPVIQRLRQRFDIAD